MLVFEFNLGILKLVLSVFRCSLMCRLYSAYDSLHSKAPSVTMLNLLCDKLDFSLTDIQVLKQFLSA